VVLTSLVRRPGYLLQRGGMGMLEGTPFRLGPAIELGRLLEVDPVQKPPAIQRDRLLRLPLVDGAPKLRDI
jgi:hypothetical protein